MNANTSKVTMNDTFADPDILSDLSQCSCPKCDSNRCFNLRNKVKCDCHQCGNFIFINHSHSAADDNFLDKEDRSHDIEPLFSLNEKTENDNSKKSLTISKENHLELSESSESLKHIVAKTAAERINLRDFLDDDNNTAELSAQVMNVPYQDFKESISYSKRETKTLNTSKITSIDIFRRIKEIYNACSCKVCECIASKPLPTENNCDCKPCQCSDCVASMNKLQKEKAKQASGGCPCIRCDRKDCKGLSKKKDDKLTSSSRSCDCDPRTDRNIFNDFREPCNCKPCECIDCKFYSKQRTVYVGRMGEDVPSSRCTCSPCECPECTQTFALTNSLRREISTGISRPANCTCDTCLSQTCDTDENNSCTCEVQKQVMRKPFEKDTRDYDIHRALISNGKYSEKPNTIAMYASINNNYPNLERNCSSCYCGDCQCLLCNIYNETANGIKASKLFEPINNVSSSVKNVCKCSPCECEVCNDDCRHSNNLDNQVDNTQSCTCNTCECINCESAAKRFCHLKGEITYPKTIDDFLSRQVCNCEICECYDCQSKYCDTSKVNFNSNDCGIYSTKKNIIKPIKVGKTTRFEGLSSKNVKVCDKFNENRLFEECNDSVIKENVNTMDILDEKENRIKLRSDPNVKSTGKKLIAVHFNANNSHTSNSSLTFLGNRNKDQPVPKPPNIHETDDNEEINKPHHVNYIDKDLSQDKENKCNETESSQYKLINYVDQILGKKVVNDELTPGDKITLNTHEENQKKNENPNINYNSHESLITSKINNEVKINMNDNKIEHAKTIQIELSKVKSLKVQNTLAQVKVFSLELKKLLHEFKEANDRFQPKIINKAFENIHPGYNKIKKYEFGLETCKHEFQRNKQVKFNCMNDPILQNNKTRKLLEEISLSRKALTKNLPNTSSNNIPPKNDAISTKRKYNVAYIVPKTAENMSLKEKYPTFIQKKNKRLDDLEKNNKLQTAKSSELPKSKFKVHTLIHTNKFHFDAPKNNLETLNETGIKAVKEFKSPRVSLTANEDTAAKLLRTSNQNDELTAVGGDDKNRTILKKNMCLNDSDLINNPIFYGRQNHGTTDQDKQRTVDIKDNTMTIIQMTKEKIVLTQRLIPVSNEDEAHKVKLMVLKRVSNHTVLVKWKLPQRTESVQGYELLVDGHTVQKISSPLRCIAVVSCLPPVDQILITIRTLVTSVQKYQLMPTTTTVYRPRH